METRWSGIWVPRRELLSAHPTPPITVVYGLTPEATCQLKTDGVVEQLEPGA